MPDQQPSQVLSARRPRAALFVGSTWLMLVLAVLVLGWEAYASWRLVDDAITSSAPTSPDGRAVADELHGFALFYSVPALASFVLSAAAVIMALRALSRWSQQHYQSADDARGRVGVYLLVAVIMFCCNPVQPWATVGLVSY